MVYIANIVGVMGVHDEVSCSLPDKSTCWIGEKACQLVMLRLEGYAGGCYSVQLKW
jgi:hypothetical protein